MLAVSNKKKFKQRKDRQSAQNCIFTSRITFNLTQVHCISIVHRHGPYSLWLSKNNNNIPYKQFFGDENEQDFKNLQTLSIYYVYFLHHDSEYKRRTVY